MLPSAAPIYEYLLGGILRGDFPIDEAIPTETELASRFNASRMSAHFAVKALQRHGLVTRRKRKGTYVAKRPGAPLARQLKGLTAKRVHVLAGFDHSAHLHWDDKTLEEMESVLADAGYSMTSVPVSPDETPNGLREQLRAVAEEGSAALVLMSSPRMTPFFQANVELIFQYHRNVFVFDRGDTPAEAWPFNVLSLDPLGEGVATGEYLYARGYRHIAFLDSSEHRRYWADERFAGLRLGLLRASDGVLSPERWSLPDDEGPRTCCERVRAAACHYAIVAPNDNRAALLIEHARTQGMAPPTDFGLMSFDNNPQYRAFNLTTVAPPLDQIGRLIGQLVTGAFMPKGTQANFIVKLPSHIIERDTIRTVPAETG